MLISLREISRVYRVGEIEIPALRGVSLDVERGEFVAIMGSSGCGKSTLMHVIGCLDRPTSGTYLLDGEEVNGLGSDALAAIRNRKLGFVFQNYNLLARTTAIENVVLPLCYGPALGAAEMTKRAMDMLGRLGLSDRMRHYPGQLSGGQQQRVAIARALVNGPSLILADEPTGNLDSRSGSEIMSFFRDLNRDGITLVMVTHDRDIARQAGRVVQMRDGEIV